MRNKRVIPKNHTKSNMRILAGNLSKNPLLEVDSSFRTFKSDQLDLAIDCKHSKDLSNAEMQWISDVTERTMQEHYEKTDGGWNRKQKEKEFRHETARLLLVRRVIDDQLVAFVHFRFELDDEQKYPVVYCYEIQMPEEVQGKGLGRHLMNTLAAIGERFKMSKVMITCFKHNTDAMGFYQKLGYIIDVCSPSRCGDDSKCYEIMNFKLKAIQGGGDS